MTETIPTESKSRKDWHRNPGCDGCAFYVLGVLGAWFYFISTAPDFVNGAVGLPKGLIWPALLVFEAMRALGM